MWKYWLPKERNTLLHNWCGLLLIYTAVIELFWFGRLRDAFSRVCLLIRGHNLWASDQINSIKQVRIKADLLVSVGLKKCLKWELMGSKEHLKVEPPLSLPRCGVSGLHGVIAEWLRCCWWSRKRRNDKLSGLTSLLHLDGTRDHNCLPLL